MKFFEKRKQNFLDCPGALSDFKGKKIIESDVLDEEGKPIPAVLHFVKLFGVHKLENSEFTYEGELEYEISLIDKNTHEIELELEYVFDEIQFNELSDISFDIIGELD